ncbi:hypothetical protein [Gordonibacter massiliensis (ex Traore et al. 2017)]|uniref:Uncharacterized protein n=1 Tax=Gordonibacter massiliensis (ex Traore et al. 2017) TaxID=1841863 RepID=A0A842JE84_9ACTN|nr:hypothetical protein [Gordonibacter massiliensis (ex Traore et al. 2017)]MBC2888801.1 hypothetical protein [Gordonibacter massiliensis (ex Traore et al. 2017)]
MSARAALPADSAETVVPPRCPKTAVPRTSVRPLTLASLVCAALVALCAIAPGRALAAPAGPFDVEGPTDAYAWDGSTLSVTANGVTIADMADPSSGSSGDVSVGTGVNYLDVGSNVRIGTLAMTGTTGLRLAGPGNEVSVWNMARSAGVSGEGAVTLGTVQQPLEVLPSATVVLAGGAPAVSIWAGGTLVLDPASSLGTITHFGGTLDLSRIPLGSPLSIVGYSVGGQYTSNTIVAPFGATRLSELLAVSNLFVNGGDTAIVEDGERVGTLQDDGSFLITATRAVTFVGWDGRVLDTETVPLFGAATAPDVSAPDGYRFAGWDRDFSYITQNVMVAARFEKLPEPTPQPAPTPAQPSGGNTAAASPTKTSKYIPAPSKLAATGDAAGPAVAGAVAATATVAATAALVLRRRERLGKG